MARRDDNVESDFDDDDDAFDQLPANTLHQLEEQAFLSTQRPRTAGTQPSFAGYQQVAHPVSSDYGSGDYEDEDVIDLNAEPISLPPAKGLPTRTSNGQRNGVPVQKPFRPPSKVNGGFQRPTRTTAPYTGSANNGQAGQSSQAVIRDGQDEVDVQALLAQVEELRQQNEALQESSRNDQALAQTKTGEAALLRRKVEATNIEFEKRLQRERETHTQAFNQQKAQLELIAKEKKQIEDNNRFLEHEVRQAHATAVSRKTTGAVRDTSAGRSKGAEQVGTPKKTNRSLPFRDGFDDEDVMVVSPSKSRQQQITPKKGGKRKRSVDPSPARVGALDFAEPVGSPVVSFNREDSERTSIVEDDNYANTRASDQHFELLQLLLNHGPLPFSEDRFIEVMSSFSFPSQPTQKLSSHVMDSIQALPQMDDFEVEMLAVLGRTCERCLEEAYYEPVNILVETTRYLLDSQPLWIASRMRLILLPIIMRTVDLVAIPIGLAGKNGTELSEEAALIEKNIDVQQGLSLLGSVAFGCVRTKNTGSSKAKAGSVNGVQTDPEAAQDTLSPIQSFWQTVQFDFILVLLMRAQPKQAIRKVLSLLQSSCLAYTFGTISVKPSGEVDQEKQSKREDATLHRLLDLLFEVPKPLKGREHQSWEQLDLALLRLDILGVFQSMCAVQSITRSKKSHGSNLLAQHPRAIGKLFRFLSDSISLLYTYSPPPLHQFINQQDHERSPHALTAQAVNITMRILHHLITSYEKEIDVRQKLAAIPGGHHRHLVSLSRLAFSDQVFLDAGIEDGTVDAAHEMLDNYLTYEEGESLVTLFSTPTAKTVTATNESTDVERRAAGAPHPAAKPDSDEEMEAVNVDDDDDDEP